jgi:hypothetical protein
MDGDGVPDRIVITTDNGFRFSYGIGHGHYTVHVHLSSTGVTVTRRFDTGGYVGRGRGHWSPWFGAADIDHVGGDEIVLGAGSGASADLLRVVSYWAGALRILPPPPHLDPSPLGTKWTVDGSAEHSLGYRCTAQGVEFRQIYSDSAHTLRWTAKRDSYVWRDSRWVHQRHEKQHLKARRDHYPTGTAYFGGFICKGLPRKYD